MAKKPAPHKTDPHETPKVGETPAAVDVETPVEPERADPELLASHGPDAIVSDERTYHITVHGVRYVHVGETAGGTWIYRPD